MGHAVPPNMPSEMLEALAMVGAIGMGATLPLRSLLDDRPDLVSRFKRLDPIKGATTFGGLLTSQELQANGVRIEALVHLALALGEGSEKVGAPLASEAYRYLGDGIAGRMEDPAEDVFAGSIRSPWGNFRVLEGLWEGGCFYLQRFVDLVGQMPDTGLFMLVRDSVRALLQLSDAVCERGQIERYELGAEMPLDRLPTNKLVPLLLKRRHLRFTTEELIGLGIERRALLSFAFSPSSRSTLLDQPLGASPLERAPILVSEDVLYLPLPTAVSSAIRYFVVDALTRSGQGEALAHALNQTYRALFAGMPVLGGSLCRLPPFRQSAGASFSEAMSEIDAGRWLHVLAFSDDLTDLDETGLAGINPASSIIGKEFDQRIAAARTWASEQVGFRGGLTLIVGCGVGRGFAVAFGEEELPEWRVVSCSAYDLTTLSWTSRFKPLTLWRMLDARDRVEALGVHLLNINGLVNLVAWARELDGHMVPHGALPDEFGVADAANMLTVDQNRQRILRHESAISFDPRVEQFIDGRWINVRRDRLSDFEDDRQAPLYATEDVEENGRPLSAYIAAKRTWWADSESPTSASSSAWYERWRTVGTWLSRAAPVLDRLDGIPADPLLWKVVFAGSLDREQPVPKPTQRLSYEQARAAFTVEVDHATRTIITNVSEAYEQALFHPHNIAERALVAALISGVVELSDASASGVNEAALLAEIVTNDDARHGHALAPQGFRDMVRPDLRGKVIKIRREDDAYIRLGWGGSVRDRASGNWIRGKADCQSFLNSLVTQLEDTILGDLARFERQALLSLLLRNHELAVVDRELWRRTSAAMLGLHGSGEAAVRRIAEHEYGLNSVFQTTRILAEMAICACPLGMGEQAGELDLSLLMARAGLLFEVGGWSDAIRWDLMKPELRVTPLGDVHANFDWHDDIILANARVISNDRVSEAVSSYAENLEESEPEPTVAHKIDPLFAAAWREQFGASIDETRTFVDFVEDLGVESGKAVLTIQRSQLRGVHIGDNVVSDEVVSNLVAALSFEPRVSWRDVPDGFEPKDRHPWRYRRRLSLLRRPLLEMSGGEEGMLLVAPGMVREAIGYMMSNLHRGDFPDQQLSPRMKAWRARTTGARGTAFANKVSAALSGAGWQTRVEINITELLGRGFDRDYGDVDVLAWRPVDGRVLIIECKNVQYRKTYGEIAEQLADFRGEVRANGKRDELRKHLDRMDLIRQHLDAVERFTGLMNLRDVESHLMFRHPVPMEYALQKMAEKVTVSRFDQIGSI